MSTGPHPWQFWIDRGGTFTDLVALTPDGRLLTHKLLSEHPERYADATLQGIADLLDKHDGTGTTPAIAAIKMGTTVGTNALLERRGEPVVLAITRGFADVLRIGNQSRPDIFALQIQRPEPLYARVTEIGGRLDAKGEELEPLDLEQAGHDLSARYAEGYRALAIVLLHAWRNPAHERALEGIARSIGFTQVSVSHRCSPAIRLVSRGDTTVADAYLSPVLHHYVGQFLTGLSGLTSPLPRVSFMQSNGGLVDASHFQGKDSILSGPAGGLVGAVAVARRAGFEKIVTFDMGGTSTDVAHYAGDLERSEETQIAGVRLRVPLLNIHTVAAGGGSILHYDGLSFRAGPDSAGANPGPVCYRRGGPLCVTDANVMLGKLQAGFFPRVFGPGGDEPIDAERVHAEFAALAQTVHRQSGQTMKPEQVAEGFVAVAVEHMAAAIKKISLERGHDLSDDYTLFAFGAAGGQHACLVAERLGLRRILLHPLAGVLSAYGMGLADHRVIRQLALLEPLTADLEPRLVAGFEDLEHTIRLEFREQNLSHVRMTLRRSLALRYQGADTVLELPFGHLPELRPAFEALHQQRFGFIYADKDLIVDSLRVEGAATENPDEVEASTIRSRRDGRHEPLTRVRMFGRGVWRDTPILERESLEVDRPITGPAIILEPTATAIIEPGWTGVLTARGDLILTQAVPAKPPRAATERDPMRLEIFNRLFMSLAEEMGYTLQSTAHSVNIKERLDFSCALFDGQGALVANAPHIPVHLGSMGESVTALIRRHGRSFRPGDVWLTNSPYDGGTHLPDITVITPLFDEAGRDILFYLASRGHHADIGGITPGSMPPGSRRIDEEGLLSDGLRLVAAGRFQEDALRAWLDSGPHPARNPAQNSADLRAQIAANARGVAGLRRLIEQYSLATVQAYMGHVQDYAEASIRRALSRLRDGECSVPLDTGAVIRVSVRVNHETSTAVIDFTGTSPQQADNLNAPAAVCQAAVLYVFRTLAPDDIPLNAGCLRPLRLIIPEGSLLNPRPPAAVVAGNVETSQHLVDALYGALDVLAASQGTMNNLTFGNERHQYYETICGGAGAGSGFAGADVVHTHMTNSRITDPEVLEWRFPVRLECFAIRRGSGGAGRWRGGDGVIRRLRFLEPMMAGILSTRRVTTPFGLQGGQAGLPGRNLWIRERKEPETLGGRAELHVMPGDILQIETPGGGAYGAPEP